MPDGGELRVLHIVPALFGKNGVLGGAERYALELARHMADVTPTRMLTFGHESHIERYGDLEVRVSGNPWYVHGEPFNPVSMAIFTESARADVIHCHQNHILATSLAAAFANIAAKKVFVTDLGGGGWDISAFVDTSRWFHGHLHISEYSRRTYGQEGDRWSHVILGGVDTEKFSPDPNLSCDGSVVFVGRLLPHKGVNYLIEAAPSDMPVKIIGQPMHQDYYEKLRSLAQGKCVTFYDDFSDADIVRAYRSAICVVLPSVYRNIYGEETRVPELLGQTLLEGMACGVPAICTDVASMPEIVEQGVSGLIVPPNDSDAIRQALLWLRDHPEQRKEMGRAARQQVLQKFTWPKVVQRCLEIYRAA